MSTFVVGALLAAVVSAQPPAPLFLLPTGSGGLCLDGSPGAYYHRSAANESFADKWVFSLQGGGECVSEEDCASRAQGDLGSSLAYASDGSGQMSQFQYYSEEHNPDFWQWNHVFVMYCTGDLFMGVVTEPDLTNQWGWAYFSGGLIVDGVIADLQARSDLAGTPFSLDQSSIVIWSGDSAGGIGAGATVDQVASLLPDTTKVVAAPIAGFYWDNKYPYTGPGALTDYVPFGVGAFQGYYDTWKMRVPERCAAGLPDTPWACGLLNFSLPFLASDVFVIEMLTDSVQLYLHSGWAVIGKPHCFVLKKKKKRQRGREEEK
mmetsp:Transcript_16375/g.32632  ORF Transcript_16375/g.32632 Transcript_16375/m.32632 type:complete len:319 (-) Transcript_16375:200-1156(-)